MSDIEWVSDECSAVGYIDGKPVVEVCGDEDGGPFYGRPFDEEIHADMGACECDSLECAISCMADKYNEYHLTEEQ